MSRIDELKLNAISDEELDEVSGGITKEAKQSIAKEAASSKQSGNKQSATKQSAAKEAKYAHGGPGDLGKVIGYCTKCKVTVYESTRSMHKNHPLTATSDSYGR